MTSHELAKLLLTLPDLPVTTFAVGHISDNLSSLRIGRMRTYYGDRIAIGDFFKCDINSPNWYVKEMYHGNAEPVSPARMEWLRANGYA